MTEHGDYAGAKLGMWLFLFTEILLFGGLFLLYSVYFSNFPEAFSEAGRHLNVVLGAANTVILLTSSLFAAMSLTALQMNERARSVRLLSGTILCALAFLAIKYVEWSDKIRDGIYPNSPQLADAPQGEAVFYSLYYMTTGLHGIHVLIGAILLGWIGIMVHTGKLTSDNSVLLENGALYWHLVDLIWIFIFPLYYLIL